jgi:hypothetical protein
MTKPKKNTRDEWERTVGKALTEVYENGLKRRLGEKGAQEFLHHIKDDDTPIANLRRKVRAH